MNRDYVKWFSPALNRDMELLVFGQAGARVLVFPTREGRFYDYEDWGLVRALAPSIEAGHLQLYCVDSVDSATFYCLSCPAHTRIAHHNSYERYILGEVLPFSQTRNANPFLIAHGCSIGAFHAVNIALRHPSKFGKVVGLSGRYDLTKPVGGFEDLFNGEYSQDIYFHTPNHYVPNLHESHHLESLRRMEIILAVGLEDPFLPSNVELSRDLHEKGIANHLLLWEGEAHRARYWRQMVQHYL
ncbi:MAG: esterase family protein [Bryobacteraceae bacterium]|nr:esterase family protein [Bryobacteraceae bacterium]